MTTPKLGCAIDLSTIKVIQVYTGRYGIMAYGQREPNFNKSSWWINADGVIYDMDEEELADIRWESLEDASFAAEHIKLMYGNYNITDEDWDDHN